TVLDERRLLGRSTSDSGSVPTHWLECSRTRRGRPCPLPSRSFLRHWCCHAHDFVSTDFKTGGFVCRRYPTDLQVHGPLSLFYGWIRISALGISVESSCAMARRRLAVATRRVKVRACRVFALTGVPYGRPFLGRFGPRW